jgi:hypothetical protein
MVSHGFQVFTSFPDFVNNLIFTSLRHRLVKVKFAYVKVDHSLITIHNMKYNQTTLDKLEDILGESDYTVRYERGMFQSGYCILEQKRVVVLNKYLNVEGRINTLVELIPQLNIEFDKLTHDSQKLYEEVTQNSSSAV